jgi:hypothetical protein
MGERLTRGQAALRVGVKRQRIDELIKDGRLKEEGATVDADELDELWATFDVTYVARDRTNKNKGGAAAAPDADNVRAMKTLNVARALSAKLKAQEAELDFKVKQGQYVPKQLVTQQTYTVLKMLSTRLTAMPRQLAPELALLLHPAEVQDRLSKEVDRLIQDLRDGLADLGKPR